MKKYFKNLAYILEHKLNVFIEGRKLGLGAWQLLMHDMSKFSKSEWSGYAKFFFNPGFGAQYFPPCKTGDFRFTNIKVKNDKIKELFNLAWLNHKHCNKHHWQYWLDIKDHKIVPLEMPIKYEKEMLADWNAMSRKFHKGKNTRLATKEWYEKQTDIILHPNTKKSVEFYFEHGFVSSDLSSVLTTK